MGTPSDDRVYGVRTVDTLGEDLYLIAGRILSDLKADQAEGNLPGNAVIVTAVQGSTITVQAHVVHTHQGEPADRTAIRSRALTVMDRYNWIGKKNRHDVRFTPSVTVRYVRSRLDAASLGSVIG
ncbi:hypothetical protein SAMN04487819_11685 [Actinopolyspora alba]|uniref:Uncharacterized protein n=1 Tax=Actinopolyspora alba TaxID=673379 RepID=A0A1I2BGX0_9ACTN|nr:hypothetical protein [Actinopolyspora alba]SFE55068.1 hypothetical protein SAMN04487819_11685 [Actinopolyspora alba]